MDNILYQNKYRIKSTRLKHWDYSSDGIYYVTICTKNRESFFGNVINGQSKLSIIGEVVSNEWVKTEQIRKYVQLDEWVVMPNHFHGIVIIQNNETNSIIRRDVARNVSTEMSQISPQSNSLSSIIRSFKSAVSNRCHKYGFHNFAWQPRYYEHIIRNEKELNRIRKYIKNNLLQWDLDRENMKN